MATPSTRTPVRIARGSYSNLNSSISDLQDGEIMYAEDQDKLYVKEGSSLVVLTQPAGNPTFTGDVTFTGASSNGIWDASANAFVANVTGNLTGTADTATEATNVTVTANNTTDETVYPLFVDGATGTQGAETDTGLTYNPSSGKLTATEFVGNIDAVDGDFDGTLEADAITVNGTALNTVIAGVTVTNATNAAHVSVADNESTNENNLIPFIEDASATGNVGLESDGDFHYNPSTGRVTATTFSDENGKLRSVPANAKTGAYTLIASDTGKVIPNTTGGWTVPASTLGAGDIVTLLNDSGSAQNITASALTALYNVTDGANIKASTIALGARAMATIWFGSGTVGYIQSAALTVS
jgi:hypothetical protein